ncbi:MAG: ribosome biosis GTPase YlqF [Pseudomonadota bacterium]
MSIQWFPGHMHLTKKAITERVKDGVDVVIELLDARLPGSSANPLLAYLTRTRPALKVLNKQDLADPARTALWLDHYNALPQTRAIGLDASDKAPAQRLIKACQALAPTRSRMDKPMRVLICGVPNVGKSTLINTMVGKRAAKTGDEPGITKVEQRIALTSGFYLYDTPGMLWPKIVVPESGYLLAASGAVGRNAFEEEVVAAELIGAIRLNYLPQLAERYKLSGDLAALNNEELLAAIGKRRAALLPGGHVNLQKAAEIVLYEFRAGQIGRITLETPEQYGAWLQAAELAEAELERLRAERKAERGGRPRRDTDLDDDDGEDEAGDFDD